METYDHIITLKKVKPDPIPSSCSNCNGKLEYTGTKWLDDNIVSVYICHTCNTQMNRGMNHLQVNYKEYEA